MKISMKSGFRLMVLAVAALVSTSAWAIWDPDGDASLLFNMNFEVYDNGAHTTTSAVLVNVPPTPPYYPLGTLVDYNSTYPNVFGETSIAGLGFDANFAEMHDSAPGKGVSEGNDCKVKVPSIIPIFDLGDVGGKHTWTFWFNMPTFEGTIIRHASIKLGQPTFENLVWEIRAYGGKIQFYHKNNSLRMETASSLSDLGLTVNTWHHAAVVIDRSNCVETSTPTTQLSAKIYVDGLEVPVIVTSLNNFNMNVDTDLYTPAPLWIGAGEREFDGLLDDVRLFSRVLTPLEVSILNQPDTSQPRALLPIPRSSNVVISTDLTWEPAGGVSAQALYFGKDPNNFGDPCKSGDGALNQAANVADLHGPLKFNTKYYWYVKSDDSNGPLWSFTSETGKAINPSPLNNAEDVNTTDVNLSWTTPTPATYAVYLSKDRALVETSDVSVRIADNNSNPFKNSVDTNSRGATYYWRVNSTYPSSGTIPGNIWSFRTKTYELVFNTAGVERTYADHAIPAYTCLAHKDGWSDACATGSLASDGVAVFNFTSDFNYDKRYDIIVVPAYRATDVCEVIFPTPLAIHVTGNFYFDGRVQIAGDDTLNNTQDITFARSGGFAGPKHNNGPPDGSVFNDRTVTLTDYWTGYDMPVGYHGRFGTIGTAKVIGVPTDLAKSVFGPGQPVNPPYKGGGGGGAGGRGGDAGRGYFFGVYTGGPSYGDKEVPVPFGGSAGGWGSKAGGSAGGGGIEIVASGNVVLDSNSQIRAHGGGQLYSTATGDGGAGGGGGGGSVRIIAGGSVTNKGIIDVNGGKGGNADGKANNTAGGGGGGRVAIFYGTTYSNTGAITADGGARGIFSLTLGLAQNGENGTIFDTNGSPKKASAPTPANGDNMVYCNPDPCTNFQLKWYSGYGGTTDSVYCDTNTNPTTSRGSVSATRGQHSVSMTVSSGKTYYMKVITDGNVSSDTWSFKTVNWQCPFAISGAVPHVGGPEWDFNHNCVLDIEDFAYFVDNWLNPAFDMYVLEFIDFARFANEWRQCFNRTDGGCAGY